MNSVSHKLTDSFGLTVNSGLETFQSAGNCLQVVQETIYGAIKCCEQKHHWKLEGKLKLNWIIIVTFFIRLEIHFHENSNMCY